MRQSKKQAESKIRNWNILRLRGMHATAKSLAYTVNDPYSVVCLRLIEWHVDNILKELGAEPESDRRKRLRDLEAQKEPKDSP